MRQGRTILNVLKKRIITSDITIDVIQKEKEIFTKKLKDPGDLVISEIKKRIAYLEIKGVKQQIEKEMCAKKLKELEDLETSEEKELAAEIRKRRMAHELSTKDIHNVIPLKKRLEKHGDDI